ncbi:hypothetical protein Tco_0319058 [Tanacetum coccineum]
MKVILRMKGSRMPNLWYCPPIQMFGPFSYLMMKLKKVRRISWELVKRWMQILRLLQYNISLPYRRQTSLNHLLLHTLKHQTLTPLDYLKKHEETVVHYANLKASTDEYYDENIAHRDQTNKLVEASMSSLEKEFIGSSTPQPSVTQEQPITIINPKIFFPQREGKGIATDEQAKDQRKLVKASFIVCPDPDAPVLFLYMINGKMFHLTAEQIEAHLDKEEQNQES